MKPTESINAPPPALNRFKGMRHIIGNTPLLEIHYAYRGERRIIYAKAENINMTGSIKDRMAYHILKQAYAAGAIKSGDTIAEATSGNTGISFSAISISFLPKSQRPMSFTL